jgi:hypothetical protein
LDFFAASSKNGAKEKPQQVKPRPVTPKAGLNVIISVVDDFQQRYWKFSRKTNDMII